MLLPYNVIITIISQSTLIQRSCNKTQQFSYLRIYRDRIIAIKTIIFDFYQKKNRETSWRYDITK